MGVTRHRMNDDNALDILFSAFKDASEERGLELDQPTIKEALQFMMKNQQEFNGDEHVLAFAEMLEQNVEALNEFTAALTIATVNKDKALSLQSILDDIIPGMKEDLKNEHGIDLDDPDLKLSPEQALIVNKEIEKALGKDGKEQLLDLFTEALQQLEKAGLYVPKPGSSPEKDAKEALEQQFKDQNSNLLGLANSHTTGTVAYPVFVFIGNSLGITDWSPDNGFAPIDSLNDAHDSAIDPSLTQKTKNNYLASGVADMACVLSANIKAFDISPPTPSVPGA